MSRLMSFLTTFQDPNLEERSMKDGTIYFFLVDNTKEQNNLPKYHVRILFIDFSTEDYPTASINSKACKYEWEQPYPFWGY